MTLFIRAFAPLRTTSRALYRPAATFHTSTARCVLNEADRDTHKDHPDRDQKIDHHKHDSVNRAKSGKGEWKPELASQSEQIVSGDRDDMSMDEMQKLGEKKAEEGKAPAGSESSKGAQ
ncbi:hypothetical protein H2198_009881 [Neophaeococcomyces mojaviensis]|uniref:Uncharacterized protein n=1 Tax=Neophaeococcomyces mojaviensis TaxID=3383035 RepID=A0ACC2ZTB3_9EURO|nr:hypothetical protein H2198_009881 [Knufia sp. JES_112]